MTADTLGLVGLIVGQSVALLVGALRLAHRLGAMETVLLALADRLARLERRQDARELAGAD